MSFVYRIDEEIGQFGETSQGARKVLARISWNGFPSKYDIRAWHPDINGGEDRPGKGITLSENEARDLLSILKEHFEK